MFVQAPGTMVAAPAYRELKAVGMTWHKLEPMDRRANSHITNYKVPVLK